MERDSMWWIGQAIALLIALTLLFRGYGGPVAAAVGYALAVLVDIRSAVMDRAAPAASQGDAP